MTATKVLPRKQKLYRIDQLSPEAKAETIKRYRDSDAKYPFDADSITEMFQNDLSEHYGLTNCEVFWSLSCCQGDGVAFTGNPDIYHWVEHDEHLAMLYLKLSVYCRLLNQDDPQLSISIVSTSHHYSHYNTMRLEVTNCASWDEGEHDGQELYQMQVDIEEYLQERIKDISKEMNKSGYDSINDMDSDEYLEQEIEARDYRFTANGHRYKRK